MKKILGIMFSFFVLIAFFNFDVSALEKQSNESKITEIGESVGLDYDETVLDIQKLADEEGLTFEITVDLLYNDYMSGQNNVDDIKIMNERSYFPNSVAGNYKPLQELSNDKAIKGDIFYFASQTAYWNHGHTGIYYNGLTIVHSIGKGDVVRAVNHNSVTAPRHTFRLSRVNTTTNKRNNASVWAYNKRGVGYNFSTNNKRCSSTLNCSQLVYCAYNSQDIDLSNGSWAFVSPWDLIADSDTYIVQEKYGY